MKKHLLIPVFLIVIFGIICVSGCQNNGGGDDTSAVLEADSTADTEEDIMKYTITYNVGNGINPASNPTTYTENDTVTLAQPICYGYVFAGWYESGKEGTAMEVTIPAGSSGDREFSATWAPNTNKTPDNTASNSEYLNKDDGLTASPNSDVISSPSGKGARKENLYKVKTVYTDIVTDGKWDEAYGYGVHLKMDLPDSKSFYADRTTGYDFYIVLGQDGKAHCFVSVVDPDIVVNSELWEHKWWHCDSFQMYYDYANHGQNSNKLWTFAAEPNKTFKQSAPSEWKVVMTEKGFNIEFAFDNNGVPFADGDELGFGLYYNDCLNYISTSSYTKHTLKTSSALNPASSSYSDPNAATQDAFVFSFESATGRVELSGPSSAEKTGDMLADIISGAADVSVIYADNASAHTVGKAEDIAKLLSQYIGKTLKAGKESIYAGRTEYEILVGLTTQPESLAALESIDFGQYSLSISEKCIAVTAFTEAGMNRAVMALYACLEWGRDGKSTDQLSEFYSGRVKNVPATNIPKPDSLTTVTDAADNAYLLLCEDSGADAFEAYAAKLVAAGYELYTENEMSTVRCRTYYDADTVINLTYCSRDRSLRAVVEPLSGTTLPMLAAESYTPSTGSSVTQVAPCNMCYILKLDNGELVVIDSGNNGTQEYIYDQMKALCGDQKPVVAAWIFTHFHQDHIGGFIEFVANGYCNKVTVKSVLYSFPSDQVLSTSSSLDKSNISRWNSTLKKTGATVYKMRTGQKYYFGNSEIEILYTYEDLMPFFVYSDDTNHTSVIFSIKLAGQKLMFVGDATNKSTRLTAVRYGTYLKSDFVQLAHHGAGDGGTYAAFYTNVGADYVLYPGDKYSPSAAEKAACDAAKKYFVRGNTSITLPLPYNG